jgi:2-C-methyl-D-erythritol 4-phosphate cytidylyltransferase
MGGFVPKQYLPLAGRPVIEHTLGRLLGHSRISALVVVLGAADDWWPHTAYAADPRVLRAPGGEERCHSVLSGLDLLAGRAAADDWVLVHDAARPCLRAADIDHLLARLADHPVGGLLGVPVRDTMKRTDASDMILDTVPREQLWHAYTPQMFRFALLRASLSAALGSGRLVTDEAAAVELAGHRPLMVEGHADNLKITRPEDLALAAFYLAQQGP